MLRRITSTRTAISFAICIALCPAVPSARADEIETRQADRPKLVLVLSGGGARGLAHVGVLKVLEELHVVPDMVVGTSMGAVVGGLYCAGWTPEELEVLVDTVDWPSLFTDRVDRRRRSFRRKQDDRPIMIQGRLHFNGLKPYLSSGIIRAEKLDLILNSLETLSVTASDFDRLPIPFRAVAADIATGEAVVLDSGSLAVAIRASMSVPGAFPTVTVNGRELVDGGVAANLPVGIARDLGADAIIAVDISSPLLAEGEELGSFLEIYNHLNSLLTASNVDRDLARLRERDILVKPELGDISFVDFDRAQEAVELGEAGARAQASELGRFAADDQRWADFMGHPKADLDQPIRIDSIRIDNTSRIDDRVVREAFSIEAPGTLEVTTLANELLELYNSRYFGSIGFHIEPRDGANELVIDTPPPPHGRGSVQFGIGIIDDFEGGSGYRLLARHQLLPVNRRGAEWQTLIQVGTTSLLATEFYQPLDPAMKWFLVPSVTFRRETFELWQDGQPTAEYLVNTSRAGLAGGRVLGNWGELRLDAYTAKLRATPRIGDPVFEAENEQRGGLDVGLRVDTLDEVVFSRSGTEAHARYSVSSGALGADSDFERIWGSVSHAVSFGEITLNPHLEYGENLEPASSVPDLFPLGGIGRLSGLGTNELLGERVVLARLLAYHRLWHMTFASLRIQFYGGLSLETGNVYDEGQAMTWDSLLAGGGIFLGANTPIGPAYLGYGWTESGRDRVYFAIGDRF